MIASPFLLFAAAAAASPVCAISGQTEPGAAVTAYRHPLAHLEAALPPPVAGAMAGRDGRFCLTSLPDGAYVLRVYAQRGKAGYWAPPDCADCCPPGKSGLAFAPAFSSRLDVRNGAYSGPPLALRPREVPAYCVRGELRDRAGALVKRDVPMRLERTAADSWSAAIKAYEGRFLLTGLADGSYKLVVAGRSYKIVVSGRHSATVVRLP